jgi:hypothetical protein
LVTDETGTNERWSEALERALAAQGATVVRLAHREALARLKTSSETPREQPEAENSSPVSVVYLPGPQVLCSSESASGARCWEPIVAALTLAQQLGGAGLEPAFGWSSARAPHPFLGCAEERSLAKSLGSGPRHQSRKARAVWRHARSGRSSVGTTGTRAHCGAAAPRVTSPRRR